MKRTLKALFLTVEVNLLFWLAALATTWESEGGVGGAKSVVIAGTVFAVVVQHWAYYAVYRQAKQM